MYLGWTGWVYPRYIVHFLAVYQLGILALAPSVTLVVKSGPRYGMNRSILIPEVSITGTRMDVAASAIGLDGS